MNKKKINIILIPFAIAVWLIVLLRVFSFSGPEWNNISGSDRHIKKMDLPDQSDTLKLLLNYRDPFISGASLFANENRPKKEVAIFQKPTEVKPPEMVFKGLIDPGEDKKEIALTIIDDHSFLLRKGDTIRGVKVVSIFRDSVIFEYKNKLFTIKNTQLKKI